MWNTLKKTWDLPLNIRKNMVEAESALSIMRQCVLLGITRSGLYYQPRRVSDTNLKIMRMIDEQYTITPFYGVERMSAWLHKEGVRTGHNKVRRLMRTMGSEAIYPKPRQSVSSPAHTICSYLLNGIKVVRPN